MSRSRESGVTLLHLSLTLSALLSLALAILLFKRPLFVMRPAATVVNALEMMPAYMRACVMNGEAWSATVADPANPSFECLRKGTPCEVAKLRPPATFITLKASVARDDMCFQKYDTKPGVTTQGFTKTGATCNGFTEAGNEACPYRFNVYWQAECPDQAAKCVNPLVRVNGDLVRGARDPQAAADKDTLARFSLRTVRGRSDRTKFFVVEEVAPRGRTALAAPCSVKGNLRFFNHGHDSGGYVSLLNNGFIEFAPGTYACRVSVPGYRVGNYKAMLLDMTTPPGRPVLAGTSEFSPMVGGFAQTRSEIIGTFKLRKKTPLAVVQFCSAASNPESEAFRSMGVPTKLGQLDETYSVMECRVL